MSPFKPLLVAPVVVAMTIVPSFAKPEPKPMRQCLAPATFLTALTGAGDWILKRSPQHAPDARTTGVVFRQSGMIEVAVFERGCLAAVLVVGKAPPDLLV